MTSRKPKLLFAYIFTAITAFFGGSMAVSASTITEGFDTFNTSYDGMTKVLALPQGWDYAGDAVLFTRDDDTYYVKRPAIMVEGTNADCYLITPELQGDFSFYMRNRTKNYQATVAAYTCTYANGELVLGSEISSKTLSKTLSGVPSWESVTFTAPNATRVALLISNAIFDDFTYTEFEAMETATLTVTGYASGATHDFGIVEEGTTHTFTLQNIGQSELTISSISVTGGFVLTEGGDLTTIGAKGLAHVTVATPAADAEGMLTIVSNDAKSPYTLQLKSIYKVPAPIMGVSITEVKFGKVTANASQEITVSNTGNAELQVAIASDKPEEFAVSHSSLTVEAGGEQTFTITYLYQPKAFGGHAATITLTPNAGEVATIAASAQVEDPNAWREEFSGNQLPDGWSVIGSASSWTFADGVATGRYEGSGRWLVTPQLVVKEGEALTFEARSYQYGSDIKVQCQKDDGAWTEKLMESRNSQEEFETYTIGGLEPGTYRFRIATENIILDNFVGFTLVPSEATKETWYVSYTFYYNDSNGNLQSESDVEKMEVEFSGDNIAFNFPNPINGNAWLRGTKAGDGVYLFSNGQYIGTFGAENAYYCGSDGASLTDITFTYDEAKQQFYCLTTLLINSSQTTASYWGYFSNVTVSKEKPTNGIEGLRMKDEGIGMKDEGVYDLQGRRVDNQYKGIVIKNGRKYIRK
ncbi:MAG: choice-of-anchor D domain-containing protein [Prevotella sp.]|nr:choice-of-anchor D domain-containing protein [Prevotella sp.]